MDFIVDDFIDGFHAVELTHLKILLKMNENSYVITSHINYESLIQEIKNTKKNKLIIYDLPILCHTHEIKYPYPNPEDREGLYFDLMYKINNKNLQILFLDTRTFRDSLMLSDNIGAPGKERYIPNPDSSLTILGTKQWNWLRKKISQEVDFRIIVSSIQFLPIGHGWESWNNFPYERKKLIKMIDKASLNQTLVISGDRHRGGIYKFKTARNKVISEATSSSLNASFPNEEEYGPLRIGKTFIEENYGVILFNSENNEMFVGLKNVNGEVVRKTTISN